MPQNCLLCHSENIVKREISAKPPGTYWFCGSCEYIFREPTERLEAQEERTRYELHENVDSQGYRRFLNPVVDSVLRHLPQNCSPKSLDYGCGPTAFLSKFFSEKGIELKKYDPFFFPDESVLSFTYDLITTTEVFEHMYEPRKEIDRIFKILNPQGILAVMTAIPPAFEIFKTWGYRREETHVGFFARKSFRYIAKEWGFEILEGKDNVWILQKQVRSNSKVDGL